MSEGTTNMLYSAGLSIGTYGLWKTIQAIYHRYYLRSECRERTLEIEIVAREPEPAPAPEPAPEPPQPSAQALQNLVKDQILHDQRADHLVGAEP
jgi:hypothetical protein